MTHITHAEGALTWSGCRVAPVLPGWAGRFRVANDLRVEEGVRGPSRTAVLTAVARALHREEPQPWVMDDYLALGLAGREGLVLLGRLRAEVPRPYLLAFSRWMCVRARFAEDIVEQAVAGGTGQYVIQAADVRAFGLR